MLFSPIGRYSDGQGIVQSRHHRHHVCISEGIHVALAQALTYATMSLFRLPMMSYDVKTHYACTPISVQCCLGYF